MGIVRAVLAALWAKDLIVYMGKLLPDREMDRRRRSTVLRQQKLLPPRPPEPPFISIDGRYQPAVASTVSAGASDALKSQKNG